MTGIAIVRRLGACCIAIAVLAACSGGGTAPQNAGLTPSASSRAVASSSRSASDDGRGGYDGHGDQNHDSDVALSSSATSLAFATASSPAQTIDFTVRDADDASLSVTLSASGVVTIKKTKDGHSHDRCDIWCQIFNWFGWFLDGNGHWQCGGGQENRPSHEYTVTPVADGTTSIIVKIKHGDDAAMLTIPVTVGTIAASPSPAPSVSPSPVGKSTPPPPSPIPTATPVPTLSLSASPVICTANCGLTGSMLAGITEKLLFPTTTLTIAENDATTGFTIASTDGNCGINQSLGPVTVAATPPSTTATLELSNAGYQALAVAAAAVTGPSTQSVSCGFTVTNSFGGSANVSVGFQIAFPVL